MASFGSGFAGGMAAGSAVAKRGMETYDNRQNEEMQNEIMQLATEGGQVDAAGNARESIIESAKNSSLGDINSALVDMYVAKNGKIDAKSYSFINDLSTNLFGIKEKEVEYQQGLEEFEMKKGLFSKKMSNYDSLISNRGKESGGYGGKPTSFMKEYQWLADNYGQEYADDFANKKARGTQKKEEEKEPSIKDINSAKTVLVETVDNFDQLPATEQYEQSKLFAKKKQLPTVEAYEAPSTGMIGGLFGMKDTKYRAAGSKSEAKTGDNNTPKKEASSKPKKAWEKFNY